jgi:hypothetical protein
VRAFVVLVVLASAVAGLSAGTRGSLFRGDIAELFASDHPQMKRIVADFDIACVGDARMINRAESPKLNGVRVGPYDFPAKPKGSAEPFCYTLHIETKAAFVDASGERVPVRRATDVREVVIAVTVSPEPPEKCFVQRPEQCE